MFSEIPFPAGISFLGRYGISTYSILLMLSFLTASYFLPKEFRRKGLNPNISDTLILLCIIGAITGSKIFFIWEIWERIWITDTGFWDTFYRVFFTWDGMKYIGGESMWGQVFSGGGLVFYGGFIVAFLLIYLYLRTKKLDVWRYGDAFAICLPLCYAIGRLGCFVSGDGCFGYSSHIHIPLITWVYGPADGYCASDPSLAWKYPYICTSGVRVWNTPILESFFSLLLFIVFFYWGRFQKFKPGMLMAIFIIWNAIVRFGVEFLRLNDAIIPIGSPSQKHGNYYNNPDYFTQWQWYGITQAQLVALILCILSLTWIFSKSCIRKNK